MYQTIRDFFSRSARKGSSGLFAQIENTDAVKISLAVAMMSVMKVDGTISSTELDKFNSFFQNEFEMSIDNIEKLMTEVDSQTDNFDDHLNLLKLEMDNRPGLKVGFMRYLNDLLVSDGVTDEEMEIFEKVRTQLFE